MGRTLIRNAAVVTMDPDLGDLRGADVLVEGETIAAIGPNLAAADAEVIDGTDRIVIPGLVNAHMHTWQTALRGVAANWTLLEYFSWVHRGLATLYRPEDIHIATLAGAIGQMDVGATTLVDWHHNNPTPEHTDAGVDALFESGIRAVFMHGSPKPDPKPGQPHFSEIPHPRSEIDRLARTRFSSPDQRVGLGMAILGPHYSTLDVARLDLALAKDYGLVASMHQGGGPAKSPGGWETLIAEGRVGANLNIVHGNDLSDELLAALVDQGVSFSVTPEGEMTQGHGVPITGRLIRLGVQPSMGVDLESLNGSDLFATARLGLACQRLQDNMASRAARGTIPDTCAVTVREALSWITIEGARMLGLDHRIGSLKPGKQADLVVLDASALNLWPVNDPVSTVVMQTHPGNVEAVMIAGRFVKRDGKLMGIDTGALKSRLAASAERILGELGLRTAA
jgi:cytosine/adenosine deaminase-related metal-dependent hydrolase